MLNTEIPKRLGLKAGEFVEVRSKDEILSTLDQNARLDELPFMPQMLQFCGGTFQVYKRVHKVCSFATKPPGNRMFDTVNLKGVQCDGHAYGGCEMECFILWKEAWLKRIEPSRSHADSGRSVERVTYGSGCSENDVWKGTRTHQDKAGEDDPMYVCQATQLPYATERLSRWDLGQYVEDYVSGNASISKILSALLFQLYHQFVVGSGIGLGSFFRLLYDVFQHLRGGLPYPWRRGEVPKNQRTPSATLDLKVGEFVRVRAYREILKTLDCDWKNRGLGFHAELSIHCGKTYKVQQRPRKLIDEKTGKLITMSNELIVLEGAGCEGRYTDPLHCPRASYPYWREIWLERVQEKASVVADKRG